MTATTEGTLLGGRVRYTQPASGFRSGIEPVLLAASIAARPGDHVLEGGAGSGAGLLCLAARVPGVSGVGIERDGTLAALAASNAAANGMHTVRLVAGDVATDIPDGPYDHAFANPPYHTSAGPISPDPKRALAKRGHAELLAIWAEALGRRLRPRGTLTFILPAASMPECLTALTAAGCPADLVLPLWPRQGTAAKLMIVRGVKAGRGRLRLLPGLVLHDLSGGFTAAAESILRGGASLSLI